MVNCLRSLSVSFIGLICVLAHVIFLAIVELVLILKSASLLLLLHDRREREREKQRRGGRQRQQVAGGSGGDRWAFAWGATVVCTVQCVRGVDAEESHEGCPAVPAAVPWGSSVAARQWSSG